MVMLIVGVRFKVIKFGGPVGHFFGCFESKSRLLPCIVKEFAQ